MSTEKTIDVLAVGNAIVDILAYKDKDFVEANGFVLGSMQLIDEKQAQQLTQNFGTATECSGGSAANTLAGMAMLGAKTEFVGKVFEDTVGRIFRKDLVKVGVEFNTPAAQEGSSTARCLVMVTEEADPYGGAPNVERTMATYLGIAGQISKEDIDRDAIARAKILFFEGYLLDSPLAKEAIDYAITIAKEVGTKVAFTLSDAFCVERHHEAFKKLVEQDVDILLCNEHEAEALFGTNDIRKLLFAVSQACETAAITRSTQGSYIIHNNAVHAVNAKLSDQVYDVTGAGDLYAAGFLYGYVKDMPPEKAGRLGAACATEVIQYLGARPMSKIDHLLNEA